MGEDSNFSFEISLSVLNHLGRNLYRSFLTVLGEAISNSWDADAENVYLFFNKEKNSFAIKDDGMGMTATDFQNKFLKIGYSKRKEAQSSPQKRRPFIGRKGIGKLALLSCARRIYILTKTEHSDYVGGVIDNSGLDEAIKDDLTPSEYHLENLDTSIFGELTKGHKNGTIIYFEDMNEGVRNSVDFLKRMIALYFRFSLVDKSFNIYVDNSKVTLEQLDPLINATQFLWIINGLQDPFIQEKLLKKPTDSLRLKDIPRKEEYRGFIASVDKPRDLKVLATDEKIGIDLFVNGRLREKDILKYIPTARVVENYIYGQIHYDSLDNKDIDRFTSSREGIIADDPEFKKLLSDLRVVLSGVIDDWDKWRVEARKDGDPENTRITKQERSSRQLFDAVTEEFVLPKGSTQQKKVDDWVNQLADDAQYNFTSYAQCFISENLIRNLIEEKNISLSEEAKKQIQDYRTRSENAKKKGNLSIELRQIDKDIAYLEMNDLAYLVDNNKSQPGPSLAKDADSYKPIRDALMHTSLLSSAAKSYLTGVFENIKGRIKDLLINS
jgi:hypothetical protein